MPGTVSAAALLVAVDLLLLADAVVAGTLGQGHAGREANRCLKRYLARNLYRLLEHGAPLAI